MTVDLRQVTVLGAGTMGAGIAQTVALAGYRTVLLDVDPSALRRGLDRAISQMEEGVRRGKIEPDRRDLARAGLSGSSDLAAAAGGADLVIEAIPEEIDLKRRTFTELGRFCRPGAILA